MINDLMLGDGWKQLRNSNDLIKMLAVNMERDWAVCIMEVKDRLTGQPRFSVSLDKIATEFERGCIFDNMAEAIRYAEMLME